MKAIHIFMISIAIPACYNHFVGNKNQIQRIPENKDSRETGTHKTILLDDEAYSITSVAKHPKNQSKAVGGSNHRLKAGKMKQRIPNFRLSLAKDTKPALEEIRSTKHAQNKSVHKKQKIKMPKEKLHKRHFGGLERTYRRARRQHGIGLQTYTFPSTGSSANTSNNSSVGKAENDFLSGPNIYDGRNDGVEGSSNNWQNSAHNSWLKANHPHSKSNPYNSFFRSPAPHGLESSNFKTAVIPIYSDGQNYNASQFFANNAMDSKRYNIGPSGEYTKPTTESTEVSWATTTVSPTSSRILQRAAIIQRNLPAAASRQSKNEKKQDVPADETESDDTVITFGGTCEQQINQTCWVQREVGEVLTLSVNISSSKKPDSFQVRWIRVYHSYESKKGKSLGIEPTKLPWNMVSGCEGREIRLNPVTNTDMDPNCIIAKVFLLTKHRGKTLFTELKKLIFRIDIPIIDMGKLYAGAELSINIENFISLPERGNLLFDWCLESKPHHYESLPSNIKISSSGRSVVLKELKKGHMGVLNCAIYSSKRVAIAKRRFNILKVAESVKRRSTVTDLKDRTINQDLQQTRRCRHVIRRSQEEAMQRLEEGQRPKSRKKRFKRMEFDNKGEREMDCELLRKKIYSRWIRSLFGEFTTEDPRLMPIEKIFELSEQGDGTLDNEIPHEVHYVPAKVKILPGTAVERSSRRAFMSNCTSDDDCGKDASCIKFVGHENSPEQKGFCNCLPEFYGDGFTCRKIPLSNHREKRLRRNANKDFSVPTHLFYERPKEILTVTTTENPEDGEDSEFPPKVLAFEDEESFLLSECIDDKDCSAHANCIQPNNGHPYCRCRPGFRGNGIFCWEIIDYVPPDEHFLSEEEEEGDPRGLPEQAMDRMASRTAVPDELEDESDT